MGLLDTPKDAAMMQMAMGLLSAGGPSRTPISLGQAFGDSGQQAMQVYRQRENDLQNNQLRDMQIQQGQIQQAELMRKRDALKAFRDQLPPQLQNRFDVDPQGFMDQLKPKSPVAVAPGASLVDPNNGYKPVFTAPDKADKPPEFVRLMNEWQSMPEGPGKVLLGQRLQTMSTHAPASQAVVNMKQETEENKAVGKAFGEQYSNLMNADMMASGKIAKYDQLSQLLDGVNTGRLTPVGTDVAAFAKSLGLDIDPKLGNKQAAEALSNAMTLELRNPSGGAGMPGALSDKDREFLTKMSPGLGKDPAANKSIIDTAKKLAQREKDVAKIARAYRKKNGTLDEGFYEELAVFSEKNPLFPVGNKKPGGVKFLGFE